MARIVYPELPDHRLTTVAAHVGFDFKNHHHALADAKACAEIAMRISG
jgi:DNA polymerase-3 subunit epsilon